MLGERFLWKSRQPSFRDAAREQSKPWMDRRKKIETGLVEVAELNADRAPAVDDVISLGDIAPGTPVCSLELRTWNAAYAGIGWREKHPLVSLRIMMHLHCSSVLSKTVPIMFDTDLKSTV
jgi:hypothetical protein